MALEPGTQLGPYAITGWLGASGMGDVYRARDTKIVLNWFEELQTRVPVDER